MTYEDALTLLAIHLLIVGLCLMGIKVNRGFAELMQDHWVFFRRRYAFFGQIRRAWRVVRRRPVEVVPLSNGRRGDLSKRHIIRW